MKVLLAPLAVAVLWIVQIPLIRVLRVYSSIHYVIVILALVDVICTITVYSISTAALYRWCTFSIASIQSCLRNCITLLTVTVYVMMAGTETVERVLGVGFDFENNGFLAISNALPSGAIGFFILPEIGILLGLLFGYYVSHRIRA